MHRPTLIAAAITLGACGTPPSTGNDALGTSAPARPAPIAKAEMERDFALNDTMSEARARKQREAPMMAPQPLSQAVPAAAPQVLMPTPADRERYQALQDNPVKLATSEPVSTFSIDVDTGAWSNTRRFLSAGRLPPANAVRVEEFINYFPYEYAPPRGAHPFSVDTELARSPWQADNLLMRVAIKGQDMAKAELPPANLVFLVDVSGSMGSQNKLPLLKSSLKLLVKQMRPQDRIALVTYAGQAGIVLPSTPGSDAGTIMAAIDNLSSGGSTAGATGIELAYRAARQGFIQNGINRILLSTDGDFNVGVTDFDQLKQMVERERKSGVSLSTLGFGTGNYNEQLMEQLADAGDGAYSYIDTLMEGHKVLVNEMTSTLATIARDVKIQVEFNPAVVREYRLIGYENRQLAREDFNNDRVDAGEIGAGHTVTAIYELTPVEAPGLITPLRYGSDPRPTRDKAKELAHVRLRYKAPGSDTSTLIERVVERTGVRPMAAASDDFRFATAIAGFGQLLRGGKYTGQWQLSDAHTLAAGALGADRFGYRGEAVRLMDLASTLSPQRPQGHARLE